VTTERIHAPDLDQPLRELLERIAAPAAPASPDLPTIGRALADLAADADYLAPWIERLGDRSGALPMHAPERGPRLTLVHRLEGQMSAVHDHGTWIVVGAVSGLETHRRYRVAGGRLDVADARCLAPTEVATLLPPDDLHDHGHLAGAGDPAYVLILAGDDQRRYRRHEWDLASGRQRILGPGVEGRWLASEPMPPV
jgi:predicted metal-dependent enzyme (double-stranded beta helix superfamily)